MLRIMIRLSAAGIEGIQLPGYHTAPWTARHCGDLPNPFDFLPYGSLTRSRYWDGVSPATFLKAVQKLLSLVKPTVKQIFFIAASVLCSRNLALLIRAVKMY